MVENTDLFLPEAFLGGSDAATTPRAGFGAWIYSESCQWRSSFQGSPALWVVL